MSNSMLLTNCLVADFDTMKLAKKDILIDKGYITKVEDHIDVDKEYEVIDCKNRLTLPAFVDSHTHLVQTLQKGQLDDLNITEWLKKMLKVQSELTAEEWYYGVALGILLGIRTGTTTFNEMTYFDQIDSVAKAYKDFDVRVTFGLGATDIAENEMIKVIPIDTHLKQAQYIYDTYHNTNNGLIRTSVAPQGLPACTSELMVTLKEFANERDLIFHTHLAEGKSETEGIVERSGLGEAEYLYEIGVLDEKTILAHSIWLEDSEVDLIAKTKANIAHCPNTNMKLSDGIAKIDQMLNKGVNVAIGCDGEASSSNRDVLREVKIGAYLQKAVTLNPKSFDLSQSYKAITINGAKALNYKDLGAIEVGNQADIAIFDMDDISVIGDDLLLSNLLNTGSGQLADTVICFGKVLMKDKKFTNSKAEEVIKKAKEIINDISQRNN